MNPVPLSCPGALHPQMLLHSIILCRLCFRESSVAKIVSCCSVKGDATHALFSGLDNSAHFQISAVSVANGERLQCR